jgi:ribonucleoside-diphosphate reductase alpha chain
MLQELKEHEGNIQEINSIPTKIKEKYKNAFDIDPQWLIKIAAYRGKWIDQSQSLNIFAKTTSGKRLSDIYVHAWQMGLKTTYYLRTLGASAIEKSTVEISRQKTKASNEAEIVVAQSANMASEVQVLKAQDILEQEPIKSCKLEDPDCESCQ